MEELEHARKRNAHIYGEIVGYGCTNDAYHITTPREDGAAAGLQNEDEECDLDYTKGTGKNRKIRYAMSNSFGFGGHNSSLVIAAFEEEQ